MSRIQANLLGGPCLACSSGLVSRPASTLYPQDVGLTTRPCCGRNITRRFFWPNVRVLACHRTLGYLSLQQKGNQIVLQRSSHCPMGRVPAMQNSNRLRGPRKFISCRFQDFNTYVSVGGARQPPDRDGQYHLLC